MRSATIIKTEPTSNVKRVFEGKSGLKQIARNFPLVKPTQHGNTNLPEGSTAKQEVFDQRKKTLQPTKVKSKKQSKKLEM